MEELISKACEYYSRAASMKVSPDDVCVLWSHVGAYSRQVIVQAHHAPQRIVSVEHIEAENKFYVDVYTRASSYEEAGK